MIRSVKDLQRCRVTATDGEIGQVDDAYFDDERWVIRYLVVDATKLEEPRTVLIAPASIRRMDWSERTIALSVSCDRVRNSPDIDTRQPVSRQHETKYLQYYGYPYYWAGAGMWGGLPAQQPVTPPPAHTARPTGDSHLRSMREVIGYGIQATDGELGHLDNFLVDDQNWAIRYAVVDTSNWWFGRKVLVAPEWIAAVEWPDRKVLVKMPRHWVKSAPPLDPAVHLVSLEEHAEFEVADRSQDPRGWPVVMAGDGGTIGKVNDLIADTSAMKVRYLDIDLESAERHFLLPVECADLAPNNRLVAVSVDPRECPADAWSVERREHPVA